MKFGIFAILAACGTPLSQKDQETLAQLDVVSYEFIGAFDTCARATVSVRIEDYCPPMYEEPIQSELANITPEEAAEYKHYQACVQEAQRTMENPCWRLEDVLCRRDQLRAQLEFSPDNLPTELRWSPHMRMLALTPWYGGNGYDGSAEWTISPICYSDTPSK